MYTNLRISMLGDETSLTTDAKWGCGEEVAYLGINYVGVVGDWLDKYYEGGTYSDQLAHRI